MDTWGISGPRFLLLYLALLAVTVAGVALARRRVLAAADGAAVPARLDRYEIAYLNGGCELVATTAVTGLLRAGHLSGPARRRRRFRLMAATAPPAGTHPVEWATYRLVAARPDHPRRALGAELCREPALAAVRERLRLGGLAPTDEQRARYRATGLWFLPLLALGVARVAAGTANGRPVGFLVALLAITVVLAVRCLRAPDATELGRRALERLRAETPRPATGASASELAMATALFGTGVLWTADVETAMALRIPREHGVFLGGSWGDGGGGLEAGHLLPVPRTRDALDVLVRNVRLAQAELPVPLALEHVAALLEWPAPELDETAFLTGLLERTGAWLLLDLANLYANARNHGGDPLAFLDALPLERVAYVHVAGGTERDGLYHDTHAHPTPPPVLELVAELCARFSSRSTGGPPRRSPGPPRPTGGPPRRSPGPPRCDPPGVMLERDDAYPPEPELAAELDAIAAAVRAGTAVRR